MFTHVSIELLLLPLQPLHEVPQNPWSASDHLGLLGAGKKSMIEDYQRDHLLEVYQNLYPNTVITWEKISVFITQYGRIESRGLIKGISEEHI